MRARSDETDPPPRTRRQWVLLSAGLALLLGGLATFAWIGWQIWGTNYVSGRRQVAAVERIQAQWDVGRDTAEVDAGLVTSIVRIPRFGKDYAIPILEGTSDDVLASGYGHFTNTAGPGELGNFALAAHRITHGEPLRNMPDLQAGDEIIIDTRTTTYTYVLDTGGADLVVPFTDTWVIDPLPTNPDGGVQPPQRKPQHLITLTTCSELFHTDNRMIAFGRLTDEQPRT